MRIQEGHFLKSALNLDLTLSDAGKCPALLKSSGIIDLGAFCVELRPLTEAKEFWSQCHIFRWRMSKNVFVKTEFRRRGILSKRLGEIYNFEF